MSSSCMPARYGYQSARAGSQRWTWASTTRSTVMLRSSRSTRPGCRAGCRRPTSGSSGPPKEIDASGCGWLRNPIHSAVATSSAPDSPAGVVDADQVRRRARRRSSSATRHRSPPRSRTASAWRSVDEVRGPGELRGRLRATSPARGRGVGHGGDAHRSTGLARVVAHRPHPRDVAADGVGDPLVLARAPARQVSPVPARPRPGSCDHDRVDPAGVARRLPSCSAAPTKSVAGGAEPIPTHLTPRDANASHSADSHRGSSVTTRHDRAPLARRPGRRRASRRTPRRTGRCWRRSSPARPRPARTPPG